MKPPPRILLTSILALATLPVFGQAAQQTAPVHTFAIEADHFTLDGKPFKILSGELHYARIPREYWHARLKMARAMGLNTIATYVFWNIHEPAPAQFDFIGNNDLAAFIRAAQEEGLYVILRAGPYSCAEWEFGGLPAWLLNNHHKPILRSNDPNFMIPAEVWMNRLAREVAPLQIGNGGPILMTQVENEYGNFGSDPAYMEHLKEIFEHAGFTKSLLYSADNWRNIPNGSIPGLYAATNFGIGNHQGGMDALEKLRPGQPLFVSEYWPGWFDHWGHPHETRPIPPQLEDLDYILHRGAGINIYVVHGGTSFGFMSGSSNTGSRFLPDVTSYDYDAPIDESGHPTPKYFAYRKLLAQYACAASSGKKAVILSGARSAESKNPRISHEAAPSSTESRAGESCLPPVPEPPPVISIPKITLTEFIPLWQNLPTPIASEQPQPMENFGQAYGYILYRTQLPAAVTGDLALDELHDYALIYLNGKLAGTLDRRDANIRNRQTTLPVTSTAPARLDILVANDGRINSTKLMQGESKGITHSVTLADQPVTNWQIYPLPMTTLPSLYVAPRLTPPIKVKTRNYTGTLEPQSVRGSISSPFLNATPTFYRGHFTLTATGDTFLDIRALGKGALWINGHAIGRFWNIGPQQTLFVPGLWLRKGRNEIVVFDLLPPSTRPHVAGLAHPILDGPVIDRTTSRQE
jgi:beta-galactosidase